jgi:hypothetical protein
MHAKPVALVSGANNGIGLQIAKDLASHGFNHRKGSVKRIYWQVFQDSLG